MKRMTPEMVPAVARLTGGATVSAGVDAVVVATGEGLAGAGACLQPLSTSAMRRMRVGARRVTMFLWMLAGAEEGSLARVGAFVAGVFAAEQAFELNLELVYVFEVAVDAGEPDVGDRIDVFEAMHDEFAN